MLSLKCRCRPGARNRCARCRKRTAEAVAKSRRKRRAKQIISKATDGARVDKTLLADDGLEDEVAVDIAVSGERRVRLTARERLLAAMAILKNGGTVRDVCVRLGLPAIVSEDLCRKTPRKNNGKNSVPYVA